MGKKPRPPKSDLATAVEAQRLLALHCYSEGFKMGNVFFRFDSSLPLTPHIWN